MGTLSMRRSSQVAAPLLASLAMSLLSACRSGPEMQRCVDENNRVVDPAACTTGRSYGGGGGGGGGHMYRYYYGGRGSYSPGTVVTDGSYAPSSGHSYSTTSGTARGGFGGSFSSGGHGGEGGGHGGGAGE